MTRTRGTWPAGRLAGQVTARADCAVRIREAEDSDKRLGQKARTGQRENSPGKRGLVVERAAAQYGPRGGAVKRAADVRGVAVGGVAVIEPRQVLACHTSKRVRSK